MEERRTTAGTKPTLMPSPSAGIVMCWSISLGLEVVVGVGDFVGELLWQVRHSFVMVRIAKSLEIDRLKGVR